MQPVDFFQKQKTLPQQISMQPVDARPRNTIMSGLKKKKKNSKKIQKKSKNKYSLLSIYLTIYTHFITQKCSGATKISIFFVYILVLAIKTYFHSLCICTRLFTQNPFFTKIAIISIIYTV